MKPITAADPPRVQMRRQMVSAAAPPVSVSVMHLGVKDPASWRFKFHGQTSGVDLTEQQPLNNIARVAAGDGRNHERPAIAAH